MAKKNIIIFLNAFWNNGKGMSGGDQMLIQILKRIRNDFGIVECFTNFDGKKVVEDDVNGVKFHTSSFCFDKLPLWLSYVLRTFQSITVLFDFRKDIVYGGSDFLPDVLPLFLFKLFHRKTKWVQCIFHIYPDWRKRPGNKRRNFIAQYMQKVSFLLARNADVVVNINFQVRDELIRLGFKKEKIFINTPGIDVEYFKNLKAAENIYEYDGSFLARLNPSKGVFDLVKIWKRVVEKKPEAKLAIIGGGSVEIKAELEREIKIEKMENNIDVLGFLENDKSFSIIKKSKVFIFPSHEEGFGIAIAEAMALGVPVVSWDLAVYDEIFENNLVKIKENNFKLFANSVIDFVDNRNNRLEFSNRAMNFIDKYSWKEIAKRHSKLLT